MLASKFFDDLYYNNAYYARVGGITNAEVNNLEMEMLRMISFSLYVSPEQYERYRTSLYDQIRWKPAAAVLAAHVAVPPPCAPVTPAGVGGGAAAHGKAEPAVVAVDMMPMEHAQSSRYRAAMGFHAMHQTAIVS